MIQIRDALRPYGMQMEVTPEIGNATAGSVGCSGTKDSSIGPTGLGQISSTVVKMSLVNPQGEVETINAGATPRRCTICAASNGLFGVIFEITFRLQNRRCCCNTSTPSFPLDPCRAARRSSAGPAGAGLYDALFQPHRGRAPLRSTARRAHLAGFSRMKRKARDKLLGDGATSLTTLLPYNRFYYLLDQFDGGRAAAAGQRAAGSAHTATIRLINSSSSAGTVADFTFWAMPISRCGRVHARLFALLQGSSSAPASVSRCCRRSTSSTGTTIRCSPTRPTRRSSPATRSTQIPTTRAGSSSTSGTTTSRRATAAAPLHPDQAAEPRDRLPRPGRAWEKLVALRAPGRTPMAASSTTISAA